MSLGVLCLGTCLVEPYVASPLLCIGLLLLYFHKRQHAKYSIEVDQCILIKFPWSCLNIMIYMLL